MWIESQCIVKAPAKVQVVGFTQIQLVYILRNTRFMSCALNTSYQSGAEIETGLIVKDLRLLFIGRQKAQLTC